VQRLRQALGDTAGWILTVAIWAVIALVVFVALKELVG
jgi:hypothetical protein